MPKIKTHRGAAKRFGVTKNGKPIMKGTCPDCGGKICRIGAVK